MDPEELGHYVALRRQYDYLGIDDLCKIPGFSGALRRARLRSPRGLAERRVVGSDTCKGTRNADWTCTVCGKVTFGSKKTDQCHHCKTVRNKVCSHGGVYIYIADNGTYGMRRLIKDLLLCGIGDFKE